MPRPAFISSIRDQYFLGTVFVNLVRQFAEPGEILIRRVVFHDVDEISRVNELLFHGSVRRCHRREFRNK